MKYAIRMVVAACFGGLFGWYVNSDYLKWHDRGREAFLDWEGRRFDRYMSHEPHLLLHLATYAVLALILAGLYEFICWMAIKVFPSRR